MGLLTQLSKRRGAGAWFFKWWKLLCSVWIWNYLVWIRIQILLFMLFWIRHKISNPKDILMNYVESIHFKYKLTKHNRFLHKKICLVSNLDPEQLFCILIWSGKKVPDLIRFGSTNLLQRSCHIGCSRTGCWALIYVFSSWWYMAFVLNPVWYRSNHAWLSISTPVYACCLIFATRTQNTVHVQYWIHLHWKGQWHKVLPK